jgi:hypothetical protein
MKLLKELEFFFHPSIEEQWEKNPALDLLDEERKFQSFYHYKVNYLELSQLKKNS